MPSVNKPDINLQAYKNGSLLCWSLNRARSFMNKQRAINQFGGTVSVVPAKIEYLGVHSQLHLISMKINRGIGFLFITKSNSLQSLRTFIEHTLGFR